jgi:hypothetical protein
MTRLARRAALRLPGVLCYFWRSAMGGGAARACKSSGRRNRHLSRREKPKVKSREHHDDANIH